MNARLKEKLSAGTRGDSVFVPFRCTLSLSSTELVYGDIAQSRAFSCVWRYWGWNVCIEAYVCGAAYVVWTVRWHMYSSSDQSNNNHNKYHLHFLARCKIKKVALAVKWSHALKSMHWLVYLLTTEMYYYENSLWDDKSFNFYGSVFYTCTIIID